MLVHLILGGRGSSFLSSRWPFSPAGGARLPGWQKPQSLPLGAWRLIGFVVRLSVAAAAIAFSDGEDRGFARVQGPGKIPQRRTHAFPGAALFGHECRGVIRKQRAELGIEKGRVLHHPVRRPYRFRGCTLSACPSRHTCQDSARRRGPPFLLLGCMIGRCDTRFPYTVRPLG